LVLNNILLAAATATVLLGTLYPLMREAASGEAISVGPPFFNLTFTPLMAALAILLPAGPLLAWKRADLPGVVQRLWWAALIAIGCGLLAFALISPRKAFSAAGVAMGAWLVIGALVELAERTRAFRTSLGETWRRLAGLPRGAWGMTLAHLGLGVFVLGACFETGWKLEAAETLPVGGRLSLGEYNLVLDEIRGVEGPNYEAERGQLRAFKGERQICAPAPERRFYPAGGQTTSEVAICTLGLDHLYVVLGERREANGQPVWLVRAYWNPWALLIFIGPGIMALGGVVSLSDRRLRLAAGRKAEASA
jgi:cytochrome c-type biogenesis protein CcmF